jgi:hypothetical protein
MKNIQLTNEQYEALREILEAVSYQISEEDEPLLPELIKIFKKDR